MTYKKYLLYFVAFITSVFVAFFFGYPQMKGYAHDAPDFESYYLAAKVWKVDGNPYQLENLIAVRSDSTDTPFPYLYTPLAAQTVMPLASLDLYDAAIIWGTGLIFAYSICIFLTGWLISYIGIRLKLIQDNLLERALVLAAAILFGMLMPYYSNLHYGQINIFILLLLLLYIRTYLHLKNLPFISGMLLGFSAIIKIVPAFLILYHLKSKKSFFVGFASGISLLVVMSIIFFGLSPWGDFVEAAPQFSYGKQVAGLWELSTVYNIALSGKFARLFNDDAQAVFISGIVCGIPVLAYFIWMAKRIQDSLLLFCLSAALGALLMVLFSPIAYFHHLVWLYPFLFFYFLFLIRYSLQLKWLWIVSCSVILFLIFMNFSFTYYTISFLASWPYFSVNTIGLILLAGMLLISIRIILKEQKV